MTNLRAKNPFGRPTYGELQPVTRNVYLFRNTVNSGVVVGDHGVAVIDSQINEPMARRLLRALRQVTDKPIRFCINTHYHWDHWAGNDVFKAEGAQLVSGSLTREFQEHRNRRQRAFLTSRGFSMPDHDPCRAWITFEGALDLDLGNLRLELRHLGRAESDDATAIHIPEERVVISGDTLMTGSFPILGQPVMPEGMGADRAWIRTLRNLRALDPAHILPGHGPLGTLADVDFFIQLQTWFLEQTERLVEAGASDPEVLATLERELPADYAAMALVWGTPRYAILRALRTYRGWQHEKPSAIPAADPADLEAALRDLEPRSSSFMDAARSLRNQGRPDVAIALLREAALRFPEECAVHEALGRTLLESARLTESVLEKGDFFSAGRAALERALELDPHNGPAMVGLGGYLAMACYQSGDDPSRGEALIRRGLQEVLEPQDRARAHFYLGLAHRAREDEAGAGLEFRKALELDPSSMPARMALADTAGGPPDGIPLRGVPERPGSSPAPTRPHP